jgi:uroporphyrinogen-III synthase
MPAQTLNPLPRVWVTRTSQDAAAWVQGLHDLGLDAQSLPLMAIGPVADGREIDLAWQQLAHHPVNYHAVMFVSANAVRYFFQAGPQPTPPWRPVRAWVTGAGSGIGKAAAIALLNAGYCVGLAGRRAEVVTLSATHMVSSIRTPPRPGR